VLALADMGKKKKKGASKPPLPFGSTPLQEDDAEPSFALPRAPERLSTPFKGALGALKKQLEERAKQEKEDAKKPRAPAPPPRPVTRKQRVLAEDEAVALSLAMQGVKPLTAQRPGRVTSTTPKVESRTGAVAPFGRSAEDEARARLDDLVAQDVNFRIEREGEFVRAARSDAPPRVVRELARRTRASETLDLHGKNQREARESIVSFVRRTHKQGLSLVCIVHGKGQHSEGGLSVLRDVAIRALTDTAAAPLVYAFVTAPEACGGSGALLVELKH
jgi:DNA-nicking Smr family endonuclease